LAARAFRGQAVDQDVVHLVADAAVVLDIVAAQPRARPEHLLQQQVGAGVAVALVEVVELGALEEAPHPAEQVVERALHRAAQRLLQGAHLGEAGQGRGLAQAHPAVQVQIEVEKGQQARGRVRRLARLGDQGVETLQAAHEARGGQVVLLAVIVGDAGGDQPDLGGDVGQGHALDALTVQDRRGGGEDRLLLFGVPLGGGARDPAVVHLSPPRSRPARGSPGPVGPDLGSPALTTRRASRFDAAFVSPESCSRVAGLRRRHGSKA
jgi:hypothetical protein